MIVRFLLFCFVIYVVWRVARALSLPKQPREAPKLVDDVLETDPVCGVRVPRQEAQAAVIGGKAVYFCSVTCREKYREREPTD